MRIKAINYLLMPLVVIVVGIGIGCIAGAALNIG
jgi:hypothetical protein